MKKLLLILGIFIMTLPTGAYYFSTSISTLLLIRLVHGAGFGLVTTYFATLAAEIIPKDRRGEDIGYFGVGETVAISIGPILGFMTLELYDFQRLFFGGMAVLFLAVTMAVFIKRVPKGKELDKQVSGTIKLFEKQVLFPAFLTFLIRIAAGGIMSFLSLYAIERDFTHVGLFFLMIAAASFIIRLLSGKLFDLCGPSIILIPSSIFPAIQTWSMNLVGEHEDALATFFNFFDLGIGGGSLSLD